MIDAEHSLHLLKVHTLDLIISMSCFVGIYLLNKSKVNSVIFRKTNQGIVTLVTDFKTFHIFDAGEELYQFCLLSTGSTLLL